MLTSATLLPGMALYLADAEYNLTVMCSQNRYKYSFHYEQPGTVLMYSTYVLNPLRALCKDRY